MTTRSAVRAYEQWKRLCDRMEKLFKEGRYANKKEKAGKENKKASRKK